MGLLSTTTFNNLNDLFINQWRIYTMRRIG